MIDVRADNLKQAPAVRFRLPALLAATTIVAVLAGMAGAYFRQQTPTAQHALMAYWGIVTTAALGGFAWRWRRAMNPDPAMGQVRWRVASAWRRRWAAPLLRTCIIAFFLLGIIHESRVMVERSAAMRASSSEFWTFVVLRSTIFGVVLGMGLIINFIYPAFVCERGVWMLHRTIMWNRLKEWGWTPGRPGVLKLRESHGQAFLTVPTPFRAAVEAFIREKTELTIPDERARRIEPDVAEETEGEAI